MFQASQVTMILGKPRIYVNGGFEIAQTGAWRSLACVERQYGFLESKYLGLTLVPLVQKENY